MADTFRDTDETLSRFADRLDSISDSLRKLDLNIQKPFDGMQASLRLSHDSLRDFNKDVDKLSNSLSKNLGEGIKSAIRNGDSFLPFLDKMRTAVEDFVLQTAVVNPVLNTLFGGDRADGRMFGPLAASKASGNAGLAGGLLGGILDLFDARAFGGPVNARQPYLVGERGPELFVPQTAGRINPNAQGSGAVHVTMNISTPDAGSFRASQTQIAAAMADAARRAQRIR